MVTQQQPGLFSRILFFIVALLATAGFFVVGATVFIVLLGFAVVAFTLFSVRVWWLKRKFMRQHGDAFRRHQADVEAVFRAQRNHNKRGEAQGTVKGVIVEGEIVEPSDNNK